MIKVFSFGGGVQPTAALVLQAQGRLGYDAFVFANVGEDSENPATLKYIEEITKPYAASNGITLVERRSVYKGEPETLVGRITDPNNHRMTPIPVYGSINGAPQPRRCTVDFKAIVVAKWIREQGHRETTQGFGITTDEIHRARTGVKIVAGVSQHMTYPLIEMGISRNNCIAIIADAGLPIPPKSSCFFCPFHSPATWKEMRQDDPELFQKAVEVERAIQKNNKSKNAEGTYYLHRALMPLDKAVDQQYNFFNELENCESGYCMV